MNFWFMESKNCDSRKKKFINHQPLIPNIRGEYMLFLRSVTTLGHTKVGIEILIDQQKINIDTVL